ncbi:hypothetical protein MMC25_006401 [Agyrium rufum]|nr:hypothetical protein [Agyrium rufum]
MKPIQIILVSSFALLASTAPLQGGAPSDAIGAGIASRGLVFKRAMVEDDGMEPNEFVVKRVFEEEKEGIYDHEFIF